MLKKRIVFFDLNKLVKDSYAVSEVMGEVLLTTIAVLLVSSIAIFISTYDGAVDVPHTQVKEWMNEQNDTIYLEHSGGEFLKTGAFEIVASINGERYVYSSDEIYANLNNSSSWGLGETIEIDTSSEWGLDIKDEDEIRVFLIDKPSKQVIQQLILSSGETENSGWVTPGGSAIDTSGGSATLLDVYEESDSLSTIYHPPKNVDLSKYQLFDFGINPLLLGLQPEDTISSTIKIVYKGNDNSYEQIKMEIWDSYPSGTWHEETLPESNSFTTYSKDISAYINTTEDLQDFKVKIVATGNANMDGKTLNIDYLALHVS